MKIEGDTIVFKSWPHNYAVEKSGKKPCTVRVIPSSELSNELYSFLEENFDYNGVANAEPKIRIVRTGENPAEFERQLLYADEIGDLAGSNIYLFCWRHEEANEE